MFFIFVWFSFWAACRGHCLVRSSIFVFVTYGRRVAWWETGESARRSRCVLLLLPLAHSTAVSGYQQEKSKNKVLGLETAFCICCIFYIFPRHANHAAAVATAIKHPSTYRNINNMIYEADTAVQVRTRYNTLYTRNEYAVYPAGTVPCFVCRRSFLVNRQQHWTTAAVPVYRNFLWCCRLCWYERYVALGWSLGAAV